MDAPGEGILSRETQVAQIVLAGYVQRRIQPLYWNTGRSDKGLAALLLSAGALVIFLLPLLNLFHTYIVEHGWRHQFSVIETHAGQSTRIISMLDLHHV